MLLFILKTFKNLIYLVVEKYCLKISYLIQIVLCVWGRKLLKLLLYVKMANILAILYAST